MQAKLFERNLVRLGIAPFDPTRAAANRWHAEPSGSAWRVRLLDAGCSPVFSVDVPDQDAACTYILGRLVAEGLAARAIAVRD
ncbi:hypothetical protein [Allokutzneria sp. NRRL B-24872]|uniref:hypothetical protein n=1 Tax=Allokutzneria sp. NRRL B-24872 TaxID=1137961 RepID=UPI001178AFCD|nr:hypothetical protein [Allokutzneria sp. NRRL B-24872]